MHQKIKDKRNNFLNKCFENTSRKYYHLKKKALGWFAKPYVSFLKTVDRVVTKNKRYCVNLIKNPSWVVWWYVNEYRPHFFPKAPLQVKIFKIYQVSSFILTRIKDYVGTISIKCWNSMADKLFSPLLEILCLYCHVQSTISRDRTVVPLSSMNILILWIRL